MKISETGKQVRVCMVGMSGRGMGQMSVLLDMPDVTVTAVCDLYADRVEAAQKFVQEQNGNLPFGDTDYRKCIDREDVDAVVITSSWETHIPIACFAMEHGKRPAIEVGGATSVDECWKMVRTSESTGVPLMFLENCCYGESELALLNMMRQNLFGTVVHCEGAYAHDLRDEIGLGDVNRHYRQRHFMNRNAELYPTHELGPIANYLRINRGNRMLSLVAMASKACGEHEWLQKNRPDTALANAEFNEGDIVKTLIKCAGGETITLTHDCTLPRFYSRGGVIRGTKGLWMEDGRFMFIEGRTPVDSASWGHRPEPDAKYMEEYMHPLWREYKVAGVRGNHDGMDFLVLKAFIESVQTETEPPLDVYDAAAWMSITALSEQSIAMGSAPVAIPDFTSGKWLEDRPNPNRDVFDAL